MVAGSDRFWLYELRVSQHFSTFYGSSVQAMNTRLGAKSTVDPDNSRIPQRWIGAPDFPSESAGTGLTSLYPKGRNGLR
jgi:hypothetical protein